MGVSAKIQSWRILIGEWWIHQWVLEVSYRYTGIPPFSDCEPDISWWNPWIPIDLSENWVDFMWFSRPFQKQSSDLSIRLISGKLYRRLWCYMVLLSCERSHSLAPRLVYYTYSGISPRIRSRKLSNRDGAQPQVVAAWWLPGRIPWPGWVRGGLGFLGDRETQGDPSLYGETNDSRHSVLLSVGFTELQISTLDGFSQTDLGYMDHPEQFLRDICRHGHSGNVWSRGHWTKGHWPLVRASVASVAE